MSESDLKKLREYFQKIQREYDTPEKATALLQREGIIDEDGEPITGPGNANLKTPPL